MRVARKVSRLAGSTLLLMAIAALLALSVGPRVLDYRTATMLSGSMKPGISAGDLVVDRPVALDRVRAGQILTYHIPIDDHRVISHRVLSVRHLTGDTIAVQTKGDSNSAADPWVAVLSDHSVWQVRWVVPKAGTVIRALRQPPVRAALSAGLPVLVVGWLLIAIWRPSRPSGSTSGSDSAVTTEPVVGAAASSANQVTGGRHRLVAAAR